MLCGHLALLAHGLGQGVRRFGRRSSPAIWPSSLSHVLALQACAIDDELVCRHSVASWQEDLLGLPSSQRAILNGRMKGALDCT